MNTNVISKKYLKNQYLDNQLSMKAISKQLGCSPMYVRKWLIKYEIPIRKQSDYVRDLDWRIRMSNAKLRASNWSGENNPNWAGGISKVKHGERSSGTLKSWRHWVKARDNWVCQMCGIDGKIKCTHCGVAPRLHADHIKSWKDYPELRFELTNGRTLCENCHIRNKSGELLGPLTAKGEGNQQPSKT